MLSSGEIFGCTRKSLGMTVPIKCIISKAFILLNTIFDLRLVFFSNTGSVDYNRCQCYWRKSGCLYRKQIDELLFLYCISDRVSLVLELLAQRLQLAHTLVTVGLSSPGILHTTNESLQHRLGFQRPARGPMLNVIHLSPVFLVSLLSCQNTVKKPQKMGGNVTAARNWVDRSSETEQKH